MIQTQCKFKFNVNLQVLVRMYSLRYVDQNFPAELQFYMQVMPAQAQQKLSFREKTAILTIYSSCFVQLLITNYENFQKYIKPYMDKSSSLNSTLQIYQQLLNQFDNRTKPQYKGYNIPIICFYSPHHSCQLNNIDMGTISRGPAHIMDTRLKI